VPPETIELDCDSNLNLDTLKTTIEKMVAPRRKLYKVYYDETNLSGSTKSIQFTAFRYFVASNYKVRGKN